MEEKNKCERERGRTERERTEEGQRERKERGIERERKIAVKIRGSKDGDNNKKLNTSSRLLKIFYFE